MDRRVTAIGVDSAERQRSRDGRLLVGQVLAIVLALIATALGPNDARAGAGQGPNSLGLDATYDVSATITWAKRRLVVTSTAHVTNTTNDPVSALSFNLLPARIGQLVLLTVTVDGAPTTSHVSDQTIVVDLPAPLGVNKETSVAIGYRATFRNNGSDKNWLFAKLEGYATAYRWIPWLSRPTPFHRTNIGDPFVTAVSDRVEVSITSDRAVVIASTGRKTGEAGLTQTFVANDVRDFAFVASPHYQTATDTFRGITITYFYRRLDLGKLRTWTERAIERFETKVGEYPYNELTIAEDHDTSAMESPQMIWMPWSTPGWNIPYLTVHELGHQWFYGVVGNDQARQPFADEGVNDFVTRDYLGHRQSRCSQDVLDKTIYDYQGQCYYEVIYVQSARYIQAYSDAVGPANFWDALQAYYAAHRFKLVTTQEFWEFMDAHTGYTGGHEDRFPSL